MASLVQQASNSSTGSTSDTVTVTLGSPTTAGNCLVALWSMFGDSASPTTAAFTLGGAADNWAQATASLATAALDAGIHIDPNCAGGQTSIVLTGNGTGAQSLMLLVQEWSGLTTTPLDATATPLRQTTNTTTWSVGPTTTTTQASEVWFAVAGAFNISGNPTVVATGTAGWTQNTQITLTTPAGYQMAQASAYQIVSATGTATYSGTDTYKTTACVCTLKAAAVIPAPPAAPRVVQRAARIRSAHF